MDNLRRLFMTARSARISSGWRSLFLPLTVAVLVLWAGGAHAASDLRLITAVKGRDWAGVRTLVRQVDVNAREADGAACPPDLIRIDLQQLRAAAAR